MLIVLTVLLVVAIICAFALAAWFIQSQKDLQVSRDRYDALDQGMTEMQESFEAEYLSWDEQQLEYRAAIQAKNRDIQKLMEISEHHSDNCIPDYAPVMDLESYLTLQTYSTQPDKYDKRIEELAVG